MPTTLTNGIQLPDKGSVDWYSSMQSNYNLIDTHLGDTDVHVTAEDKANWNSKQGSLSQDQLDAIAQVATNTSDIATLQSGKADTSHTHSSSDITDIGDYATKQYVDNSISGLVDNAPDALNTLNELSAALNDDSNFASTVTTALAAKADSADLATVATSGSYNDLTDKPTINDSTITIQKNGSTVDTFTTNGSNKTINISVPTKTSDLTNDSNFVDSSNPAVASGITSAKVTDYDTHIADTDIHVTTADKDRWNNQTYVFRYSSTALVASSINSNALLDNTDNLKVGDKVIDSSGVLFSITAIDTANSTFTIGTALIDLAQDSDVVHKTGNEFISGDKTFANRLIIYNASASSQSDVPYIWFKNGFMERGSTTNVGEQGIKFVDKNVNNISSIESSNNSSGYSDLTLTVYNLDGDNVRNTGLVIRRGAITSKVHPYSDNVTALGETNRRWSKVYATNYYYGSNNVEFSTKFVTTDTNQTISGNKTFSSDLSVANTDTTANTPNLNLRNYKVDRGTTDTGVQTIQFLDKNGKALTLIESRKISNGNTGTNILTYNTDDSNNTVSGGVSIIKGKTDTSFAPNADNAVTCGRPLAKWSDVQTYKVNNLEPSSLSLPSGNVNDVIDISSYLVNLDGTDNTYVAPSNGWISITMSSCSGIQAYITGLWGHQIVRPTVGGVRFFMPVLKNKTINILIFGGTIDNARFIPCQGNV